KENPVAEFGFEGFPINVEEVGISRAASVLQHILPPGIVSVSYAHVVGHSVQNQGHAVSMEFRNQRLKFFFAADLRVEAVVIGDVVAMRAAGAGFQQWRGITVRDPESA